MGSRLRLQATTGRQGSGSRLRVAVDFELRTRNPQHRFYHLPLIRHPPITCLKVFRLTTEGCFGNFYCGTVGGKDGIDFAMGYG